MAAVWMVEVHATLWVYRGIDKCVCTEIEREQKGGVPFPRVLHEADEWSGRWIHTMPGGIRTATGFQLRNCGRLWTVTFAFMKLEIPQKLVISLCLVWADTPDQRYVHHWLTTHIQGKKTILKPALTLSIETLTRSWCSTLLIGRPPLIVAIRNFFTHKLLRTGLSEKLWLPWPMNVIIWHLRAVYDIMLDRPRIFKLAIVVLAATMFVTNYQQLLSHFY